MSPVKIWSQDFSCGVEFPTETLDDLSKPGRVSMSSVKFITERANVSESQLQCREIDRHEQLNELVHVEGETGEDDPTVTTLKQVAHRKRGHRTARIEPIDAHAQGAEMGAGRHEIDLAQLVVPFLDMSNVHAGVGKRLQPRLREPRPAL